MSRLLLFVILCFTTMPLSAESAGGLSWTAPSSWKDAGQKPMRIATYVVPAFGGDRENGECAVYYFGRGQGGSAMANVKRWVGQFRATDGGSAEGLAKTTKDTVNGVAVTTVDVTGTYMFKASPRSPQATPKPGYRMLAVIAEGPEGPVFFKLTAPEKTTTAAAAEFRKMIATLRP